MKSISKALKQSFVYHLVHPINVFLRKRKKKKRNRFFAEEANSLLREFARIMNSNQVVVWLDFGTLLGFYREHDFIPHDCDLDFGSYLYNQPIIRQALITSGFKLVREFYSLNDGGMEECYMFKHTTMDVFYYREHNSRLVCNGFRPLETINFFLLKKRIPAKVEEYIMPNTGFIEIEYKNCRLWIPKETESYLRMNYGDDFMVPNPGFKYQEVATNVSFYDYEEKPGVAIYYKDL